MHHIKNSDLAWNSIFKEPNGRKKANQDLQSMQIISTF